MPPPPTRKPDLLLSRKVTRCQLVRLAMRLQRRLLLRADPRRPRDGTPRVKPAPRGGIHGGRDLPLQQDRCPCPLHIRVRHPNPAPPSPGGRMLLVILDGTS